jgi:hypothetical protein
MSSEPPCASHEIAVEIRVSTRDARRGVDTATSGAVADTVGPMGIPSHLANSATYRTSMPTGSNCRVTNGHGRSRRSRRAAPKFGRGVSVGANCKRMTHARGMPLSGKLRGVGESHMVMDLTEPIPALVLTPRRLLRIAMFVGASGVAALLVAVGVLVWTYSGLRPDSQEQTVPADMSSKPVAAAPAEALAPEPAPAPVAAPPAPAAAPASGANAEILRNPAMAAIAPTASTGSSSVPASTSGSGSGIPTVRLPGSSVPTVDWNAAGSTLGLQNLNWAGLLFQGSGADATTGAAIGAATAIGNNALDLVANNGVNVLNTLILANSGFYGRGSGLPSVGLPGVGLPDPQQAVTALATSAAVIPQIGLPAPPQIGLPGVGLPSLPPPPHIGLPGIGIGIPGTPIGIGF